MLEFFRRHRGPFMITVAIIVIVSFAFWGGSKRAGVDPTRDPHETAFTIYGRDYTSAELSKFNRTLGLSLYGLNMFDIYELATLVQDTKLQDHPETNIDFVANLLVLREIAVKNGVAASDAEARKKMETLRPFQKDGKFDENTAAEMEERLKANGFSDDDIMQLIKDSINLERLKEFVTGNYSESPTVAEKSYAHNQQTIKASTITFALDDFKKKAEAKDEDIKKYYDENKDGYMSPEKRAAVYVFFETVKADEKRKAEENEAAKKSYATLVYDFDKGLREPGAEFNTVVATFQKAHPEIKLQTLNLFDRATPPEAIKDEPKLIGELFRQTLKTGEVSNVIDGAKGYYFFKLTQVDEPKQQELKEVQDKIKETLVAQKAQEAMLAAANDARTVVVDGLKAGKKLDDIAKEKGWKVEGLPEFSPANVPPTPPSLSTYSKAAADTPAGGVTKPQTDDKGATLVIVTAKELRKRDDSATLKTSEGANLASQTKNEIFKAWFTKQREAAKLSLALR